MVHTLAKEKRDTTFGDRLKALRGAANMTQQQLADAVGMTVGNIGRLESGLRQPSWETARRLAEALGVSTDAFKPESE